MLKHLLLATALALPLAPAVVAQGADPAAEAPAAAAPDSLAERTGDIVHSPTGDPLGELSGVIGDEGSERAVVSFGGMLGLGETEVLVPAEEISIQPGGEGGQPRLVVSMGEDELKAMPPYDPKQDQAAEVATAVTPDTAPPEPPAEPASAEGLGAEAEEAVADALARVEQAWSEVETATSDGWQSARDNFNQAVADLERTWDEVTASEQTAAQPEQ